jgi:hypothetical protein
MAPLDLRLGELTTFGAAFVALRACKAPTTPTRKVRIAEA